MLVLGDPVVRSGKVRVSWVYILTEAQDIKKRWQEYTRIIQK